MTFDDLISMTPDVNLASLIRLFLLGYDDKIYIDILIKGEPVLEGVRIINPQLQVFYERKIEYFEEGDYDSHSILKIALKGEK